VLVGVQCKWTRPQPSLVRNQAVFIGIGVLPAATSVETIGGRIRFIGAFSVDLPTALVRDLPHLSASVGLGDAELGARLAAMVQAIVLAVPSYRGLDLTVYDGDQPVSLAVFLDTDDGAISTSLRLPFAALGDGLHRRSRIVFYAATPGAFVDLAADLGHAVQAPVIFSTAWLSATDGAEGDGHDGDHRDGHNRDHQDGRGAIVLDADLPPRTLTSGLTGLDELSAINRAVGMLVEQGHSPDEAHHTLRHHATAAGVEPYVYAARMLTD
jgi:hypothetical protein